MIEILSRRLEENFTSEIYNTVGFLLIWCKAGYWKLKIQEAISDLLKQTWGIRTCWIWIERIDHRSLLDYFLSSFPSLCLIFRYFCVIRSYDTKSPCDISRKKFEYEKKRDEKIYLRCQKSLGTRFLNVSEFLWS